MTHSKPLLSRATLVEQGTAGLQWASMGWTSLLRSKATGKPGDAKTPGAHFRPRADSAFIAPREESGEELDKRAPRATSDDTNVLTALVAHNDSTSRG